MNSKDLNETKYQSPIKYFEEFNKVREDALMQEVHAKIHVEVDKEELLKALNYDRGQYHIGYRDACEIKDQEIEKIRDELQIERFTTRGLCRDFYRETKYLEKLEEALYEVAAKELFKVSQEAGIGYILNGKNVSNEKEMAKWIIRQAKRRNQGESKGTYRYKYEEADEWER